MLISEVVLIDGWKVIWFCEGIVQIDAIDHEVYGVFALARRIVWN